MNSNHSSPNLKRYLPAMTLGLNMAVGMAVFSLLGYYIGQELNKEFSLTLIGIFLGILYCVYEVFKVVKHLEQPSHQQDKENLKEQ